MILVVIYLIFIIAVVGGVYVFLIKPSADANDPKKTDNDHAGGAGKGSGVGDGAGDKGGRKGGSRMQLNRRRPRQQGRGDGEDEGQDDGEDGAAEDPAAPAGPGAGAGDVKKKGKKRLAKEERKREEKEYKEAMRAQKEEKKTKHGSKMAERDAAREEAERREEEELAKLRAEKEKAEEEEYDKWKDLISVDDTGDVEAEIQQESQGLLGEFVKYIKEHKVVILEDLAAEFGLKAKDAITRVQALEQMGRITGVMDDRGKFIYITEEELSAVAKYIEKEGRVSISELASASNNLIQLNSKVEIKAEALDDDDDEADGGDA